MSWVDLVVVALALLAAISGWRHGMAVALLSFVGVLGGAIIGVRVAPLLAEGGSLVAWKGAVAPEELADGHAAARILGLEPAEPLRVHPYAGARDHTLHAFRKIAPTPDRFPRRAGMATKRPLSVKTSLQV